MKSNRILEGTIWSSLIFFALPIALSSLLQQLFNAADQAVVGHFAGSLALAAVGANTSITSLLVNVFTSISIGTNALIARKIGEGDKDAIGRIVHTSITFAAIAGTVLALFGILAAKPLLILIGTPDNVLEQASIYLRIFSIGIPFSLLYNFGSAVLRSIGDTKRPMIALVSAGISNVFMNLFFVIVLGMGVAGVATATAIANMLSAAIVLSILMREKSELHLSLKSLGIQGSALKQVLQIGGPAGLQSAVFSIANICIQSGINSLGSNAMAGTVAVMNYEYISFFITGAFNQSVITFCSQNYGAGKLDRCRKVIGTALLEAIIGEMAFDLVCVLSMKYLVSVFTTDPAVAEFAYTRMYIVVGLHFMIAFYEVLSASLRSLGYSMAPALLTIVGCVIFRVSWLFTVFKAYPTYKMLMFVYPASWLVTTALVGGFYLLKRKKLFFRTA